MKNKPTVKRITKATLNRREQIQDDIYKILIKEVKGVFDFINKRDESLVNRLNDMEQNGVPKNTLEDINRKLSALEYNQRRLIKANESLLQFFNITKDFLTTKQNETKILKNGK